MFNPLKAGGSESMCSLGRGRLVPPPPNSRVEMHVQGQLKEKN